MKQFWLICMCLCGSFLIKAQSYELAKADSLFQKGLYYHAAIAYEKALFFENNTSEHTSLLLQRAECFRQLGNYSLSYETLNRIRLKRRDSILGKQVAFQKILDAHLLGDAPKVKNELLKYQLKYLSDIKDETLLIIQFLNHLALEQIDDARQLLADNHNILSIESSEVENILPSGFKLKSREKARNLSKFLPGIGQMYSGYFFKGLVSGGIQASLLGFSTLSFLNGYFFTGTLSGVALFHNFYVGGIRYSGQLAERKNVTIKNDVRKRFFESIKKPEI